MRALVAAALIGALSGCAEELTPQSLVYDMRVLAVRAEPAAAAPGETIRLDALVVDPFGGTRDLSFLWAACVNPPADSPVRCLETSTPQLLGDDDAVDAVIPADALATRQRGTLGVLLFVCAGGTLTLGERGASCDGDDTAQIVAVKRVPIEAEPDNDNPEIAEVLFDGRPFGEDDLPSVSSCTGDCTAHTLTVRASDESEETYDDDGAELREELISSFSATSGQMEVPFGFGATTEVEWTPPLGTGLVLFWFALRDDRGGVTWVERQAVVD